MKNICNKCVYEKECKRSKTLEKCESFRILTKEKNIERACIAYARRRGWDCWKNENNGNKGIPDYSLLSPEGRFLMVEFKRSATANVRPEQKRWASRHPETVFFCHDIETFTKILEQ